MPCLICSTLSLKNGQNNIISGRILKGMLLGREVVVVVVVVPNSCLVTVYSYLAVG